MLFAQDNFVDYVCHDCHNTLVDSGINSKQLSLFGMNLAEWVFLIQSGFSCSRITCSKFCALNNAIPVCLEFTWQYPPSEFLLKKMRAVFFLFFFLSISPFTVGCYDCLYDYIIVQLKGLHENSNFFLSYQKLWLIFIVSLC